jgi:hypothetical protein
MGNLDMVRVFVKELGADINQATHNGRTPLMDATVSHNIKIVQLLLKGGADAQASILLRGTRFTAASGAASSGYPAELVEYLEAKTHCSKLGCSGAGIQKCTRCKQARYCGRACQLAHWPAHEAECKARQADHEAIEFY